MSGSQGSGRAIQILPSIVDNGARRNSAPLARLTGLLCTIQDGPHGSLHGAVHQSQDGSRMLEKPELAYSPYPSTRADMRSPHPAGAAPVVAGRSECSCPLPRPGGRHADAGEVADGERNGGVGHAFGAQREDVLVDRGHAAPD